MKSGTWEEPQNVYSVRVEGPSGGDWLQARGKSAADAAAVVREIVMPGVRVTAVEFAGTSERWAA